jgi:hypothetical protein
VVTPVMYLLIVQGDPANKADQEPANAV